MKIQILSDLHLEFRPDFIPGQTNADTLILAGDILVADYLVRSETSPYYKNAKKNRQFLLHCANNYKHVIYVMGNHEHYDGRWNDTKTKLQNIIVDINRASMYGEIHLLDKESIKIDDVLFVGATLWTDANNGCPNTEYAVEKFMNDYRYIQIKTPSGIYRKLRMFDTILDHRQAMEFLQTAVPFNEKVVVISHHAPHDMSVPDKFKGKNYENGGFRSDLSEFILDHPNINLWVHGHMHSKSDYMIGNTRIVCNPRGYSDKENPEFDNNFVIEL